MDEIQAQNLLLTIFSSLSHLSPESYKKVWEQHENSIDFITDGEIKRLIGISYDVDPRVTLHLQPSPINLKGSLTGIQLKLFARIRMKDFTTGKSDIVQFYNFYYYTSYPLLGPKEKFWEKKICHLNKEIRATSYRLQRKYTPSHRLSKIVGRDPKPKYQILDLVSDYILSNNLRLSNGAVKVDGHLKHFYGKNTVTVCENLFFETLRENTLISENHLKLISTIQGRLNAAQRTNRRHSLVNNGTSSCPSQYIEGPIA